MQDAAHTRSSRRNKSQGTSAAPARNAKNPESSSGAHRTEKGAGGDVASTSVSYATDESVLPQKLQEFVPESVEHTTPNALHDAGEQSVTQSSRWVSHAKPGGSIFPEFVQKLVPETIERMLPNVIHDTGDKKIFEK